MTGVTTWWAKDSGWWRRERVVALGLEFGAAGPAVLDWLTCEADAQRDSGRVKAGYRAIAHGAFVPVDDVRPIVSACVRLCLLDEFRSVDGADGDVFVCRISGWKADQDRVHDRMRKRAERAAREAVRTETPANREKNASAASGRTGTGPGVSESVPDGPKCHSNPTPPHRELPPLTPPDGGEWTGPPTKPKGVRGRDRDRYDAELAGYAAWLLPDLEPRRRQPAVLWALGVIRGEATNDAIRDAVARSPLWAPADQAATAGSTA